MYWNYWSNDNNNNDNNKNDNVHVISYEIYHTIIQQRIIGLSVKIHSLLNLKVNQIWGGPFFVPFAENVIRASDGDVIQFHCKFSLNCPCHFPRTLCESLERKFQEYQEHP